MAKHPAAFINAIADEGTKEEAIQHLQEAWDDLCEARLSRDSVIAKLRDTQSKLGEWEKADSKAVADLQRYVDGLETRLDEYRYLAQRGHEIMDRLASAIADLHLDISLEGVDSWLDSASSAAVGAPFQAWPSRDVEKRRRCAKPWQVMEGLIYCDLPAGHEGPCHGEPRDVERQEEYKHQAVSVNLPKPRDDDEWSLVTNTIRYWDDRMKRNLAEKIFGSGSQYPDLSKCPGCGGPADNGHDRCIPPNPYYCSRCEDSEGREPDPIEAFRALYEALSEQGRKELAAAAQGYEDWPHEVMECVSERQLPEDDERCGFRANLGTGKRCVLFWGHEGDHEFGSDSDRRTPDFPPQGAGSDIKV